MRLAKRMGILLLAVGTLELADMGMLSIGVAEARVGRPLTPVSAAGVARRTTRRVVRRGAYVATLPAGCVYYAPYYSCNGVYYEQTVQNNTTVYVTVELSD